MTYIRSSTGSNAIVSVGGTQGTLSVTTMSDEERKELEQLRKDHDLEIKTTKLNIFKALSPDVRQRTLDLFEWVNCRQTMDATTIPQSERLAQLSMKEAMTGSMTLKAYMSNGSGITWYTSSGMHTEPNLPDGITLEDLKKAHMEASLEESINGGESNV